MRFALRTFLLIAAFSAFAADKVKISSVPHEFTPNSGSGSSEPVSVSEFYFEVNPETQRARVFIHYTFRGQGAVEDGPGPTPTYAQLPQLMYDSAAQAVIYESDNLRTICAKVKTGHGVFGSRTKAKSTGNCFVTTQIAERREDDGWGIRPYHVLDVYFQTR